MKNGSQDLKLKPGLTRAFFVCTTRWRRPPAVPAAVGGGPGRRWRQYLQVRKQREQTGSKCMFYWQDSLNCVTYFHWK